ncbi:uncharacterized protein TRIADDRAFT_59433 [Trichoplax adhaerens]|uniref:Uncharacterized protein n=1 Tax=Trichoplax adhaerens TaxID=10228 RepID=B3S5P9_TRIAD|nr:predicted protein [Trichoplax adhaerens]EDV21833.1 predicted protein [Trichoplax adhaerens]|eukprot:XP_002115470.1 predicted protein [Trichoplax adhaerens]
MSSPSTLLHTISSTHDKTTNNYIHRGQLFDPTIPNTSVDPYKTTSNYNNHTAATPLVYCFYSPTTGYPYETATSVPNAATALTSTLPNDYKQFSAEVLKVVNKGLNFNVEENKLSGRNRN